jgi:hypothetical protein
MDPITATLVAAGIGAAGSAASGYLSGAGSARKETKMEKTKRKLVDQLIASLGGNGPFSDLYNFDENVFNKSFVEPAQAKFRNQIAPQIQQQYIQYGQQRGTGLDDTLTRAGVDLDAELNKFMYQAQQDAMNRKQNTIGGILNSGSGAQNTPSAGQDIMSGLGGFIASDKFSDSVNDILKQYMKPQYGQQPTRPGYEPQYGAGGYIG